MFVRVFSHTLKLLRKSTTLLSIKPTVLAVVDTLEKLEMNAREPSLQNLYFHYKKTLIRLLNACITWMKTVSKALSSCKCSITHPFRHSKKHWQHTFEHTAALNHYFTMVATVLVGQHVYTNTRFTGFGIKNTALPHTQVSLRGRPRLASWISRKELSWMPEQDVG